ncbi:sodium-dependent glucose transporter 1A-like [Saccostrea echinata]|uniref:sodium-dependent glucose transporter 1A-like n=1 Tax=Saccostrea echinata TaxID=191078 RepID=UPI002A835459|nr:sodium-dependent glucose transporter 1A-like [Saccostrea echinata]
MSLTDSCEPKVQPTGPSTIQKIIKTVFLVSIWTCIGLCIEIAGPTLKDLKLRVDLDYEEVSRAVSGRSVGYFIGSAMGGLLVDRLDPYCDLMLAACLDMMGTTTIVLPFSQSIGLMWFLFVMQGTFEGILNIVGQKLVLEIWREKASSPLFILHFGFGIGSFIVPQIANPFLAVPKTTASQNTSNISTPNISTVLPVSTKAFINDSLITEYLQESRIEWAYLIVAIITIGLSAVFYYYQFCGKWSRNTKVNYSKKNSYIPPTIREIFDPATCANGNRLFGVHILGLLFLFFFNAVGGERVYGKFIRSFAIDYSKFDGDEASLINSSFWISFAIGRFAGFIAARWIPIRIILLIEGTGALVSAILLNVFADDSSVMLWILTQPMAFFIAPCFPSGVGWADFHVHLSGLGITFLLLGGALGGVCYMWIIGHFYENDGPLSFFYVMQAYGILMCVLVLIMHFFTWGKGHRFQNEEKGVVETVDMEEEKFSVKQT